MKLRDFLLVGSVGLGCVDEPVVKKPRSGGLVEVGGFVAYKQSLDKLMMVERGERFNLEVLKECENQVASELASSNAVLKVSTFLKLWNGNCSGVKDKLECEKILADEMFGSYSKEEYFQTKVMVVNKLIKCLEEVGKSSYEFWYSFRNLNENDYVDFVTGNRPVFVVFFNDNSDESRVKLWKYFKDVSKEDLKKVKVGKVLALDNWDFYNKNAVVVLEDGRTVKVEGLIFVNGEVLSFVLKDEIGKFKDFLEVYKGGKSQ